MANLFNISSKYLFGLGALATVGISSLVSWLPRPDKSFFTATDTYVENGVRKVFSGEKQNIPAEFISSFGEGALFALTHVKDLCFNNPFYTLGVSFVVYLGYKFTNLFICSFSDVFKKIQYFFFGDSKLRAAEILEKGNLKATEDLQKLLDLQQQFSKDMCKLFLELSETITQKLIQTNELIEQGNNATCQLVMTMKTVQDETFKSLETVITNTVTTLHEHRTFILNTLDHVQLDLLEKLQTIHETTYNIRRMTVDIVTEVIGNSDGPLIQTNVAKVPYAREVHDQGSGTGNVVHKDQGVATDDVNIVGQNSDIGNVGHQDHTVVTVEDVETNNDVGTVVQGDQNQFDSLRDEYFNSLNQELPSFDRQPFSRNLINDMTLEEVRNIPHPYGLDMTDSSANSVLESFDWSIMYSIQNISMLIIFFGLLVYYCVKKRTSLYFI